MVTRYFPSTSLLSGMPAASQLPSAGADPETYKTWSFGVLGGAVTASVTDTGCIRSWKTASAAACSDCDARVCTTYHPAMASNATTSTTTPPPTIFRFTGFPRFADVLTGLNHNRPGRARHAISCLATNGLMSVPSLRKAPCHLEGSGSDPRDLRVKNPFDSEVLHVASAPFGMTRAQRGDVTVQIIARSDPARPPAACP